jgi:hypothetical protein
MFNPSGQDSCLRLAGVSTSLGCIFYWGIVVYLVYVDESGDDGFTKSGIYLNSTLQIPPSYL